MYTVAVLAYQGRYGTAFAQPTDLLQPSAGSLEDLFHRTGLPYAFLDLSQAGRLPGWLKGPLIARPMGVHGDAGSMETGVRRRPLLRPDGGQRETVANSALSGTPQACGTGSQLAGWHLILKRATLI